MLVAKREKIEAGDRSRQFICLAEEVSNGEVRCYREVCLDKGSKHDGLKERT